jgi:hypothetical protein
MRNKLFYKGDYDNKLPYKYTLLDADKSKASYKYYELIQRVGQTSCLT